MFVFSVVDTLAKYLTSEMHPIQVVWSRQMGLVAGIAIALLLRGPSILKSVRPGLQIARGCFAAGSATLFIVAVSYVPLADAVAVSFVAPFIVTLLGAWILKEPVGIRRWIAVGIGFLATMIIIRPGTGVLHPAVFLVMIAAFLFALRQIVSRVLGSADPTVTTVAYTAIVSVAILTVPLPFVWSTPQGWDIIGVICVMAALAAVAETLVIKALEVTQAVIVAPLQYTMIIWGTLWGFLVFADFPDFWTWIGALIITVTGIYTLNRERLANKKPRATPEAK